MITTLGSAPEPTFPWLDEIQAAVVVYDTDARLVAANRTARALLGAGAEPLALLGADGAGLGPTEHPVAGVLATHAPVHGLAGRVRRPDGELVPVQVHASPHCAADGQLTHVVVTCIDVTGSLKAQAAQEQSEARYRLLFESMDAAVLLMRPDACVACNPATLKLFGATRYEQILGKTPLDFAPERQPDGRLSVDVVRENTLLAIQHGTCAFEWQSSRIDGEPLMLDVRFTPFAAGGEHLFQCIALDITERKRAEKVLKKSEAWFRAIFESAATGILVADVATRRFRYANPEVCRMFGYSAAELLALGVDDIHPAEALQGVIVELERQGRGEVSEARGPCRRKDGSEFVAGIRTVSLHLEGRPCHVGFFRDITAETRAEQDRLRAQKLDAIGVMAGGIAHDFNNLLQGVFGAIAAAAQQYDDKAKCLEILQRAEGGLRMAVGLTTQLLTFSRGGSPVKRLVDVAPVVETAAKFALVGSTVEGRFELEKDLWSVEADEGQLAQVIQNVVLNAQQAMPGGGVVRVAARNVRSPRPRVHLVPGPWVAIEVEDSGAGISEQLLPRIFDPWFTTKERGTGLGLAVSYSIVQGHGGVIDVRSEVGRGTTFTIYLPAREARATASPEVVAPTRAARILVMDDDELVRSSAECLLRSLGHDVECAEDGAAAVQKYRAARQAGAAFDVVILDLTVRGGGMGGADAIKLLRREDPAVRAVVSSGYSNEPVVANFGQYGFRGALPKPYTLRELERELAAALA